MAADGMETNEKIFAWLPCQYNISQIYLAERKKYLKQKKGGNFFQRTWNAHYNTRVKKMSKIKRLWRSFITILRHKIVFSHVQSRSHPPHPIRFHLICSCARFSATVLTVFTFHAMNRESFCVCIENFFSFSFSVFCSSVVLFQPCGGEICLSVEFNAANKIHTMNIKLLFKEN